MSLKWNKLSQIKIWAPNKTKLAELRAETDLPLSLTDLANQAIAAGLPHLAKKLKAVAKG